MNGIRTDLPATPNVGASRLSSSTSGSRDGLPTGTANTGMSFSRSADAASTGGWPSFQSPSEASTIAAQVLELLRRLGQRLVQVRCLGSVAARRTAE